MDGGVEVDPQALAAVFRAGLSTGGVDKNSTHRFSGSAKKVRAAIPLWPAVVAHEP
jgi:hypothetical protein